MPLGAKNMQASYILEGVQLGKSMVEKDLEVLVAHKLNNNMQCQAAVSKASKVLSCIKRGMDSRERYHFAPVQIISKTSSGVCSSVLGTSS